MQSQDLNPNQNGHDMHAEASVNPTVEAVVAFEDLPLGANGSRRALVRWSDGSEGEAARWFDDEILLSEGDLIGKSADEIRSLIFRRDRDHLQGG
jgi:hypothetical protein